MITLRSTFFSLLFSTSLLLSPSATDNTWRPLSNPATEQALRTVQEHTQTLRKIELDHAVPANVLDSKSLQGLFLDELSAETTESLRAQEGFLKSLNAAPSDFQLARTYLSLLDEQAGGVYDPKSKHLFVHEQFDVGASELAQMILAHEICHALQDSAFDLRKKPTGYGSDTDMAWTCMAEGDAMLLMEQYAAKYNTVRQLAEMPRLLFMNQSALKAAPAYLREGLFFPYIQGEAFFKALMVKDPAWRDQAFRKPPVTTAQVIHPDKYLRGDLPASITLTTEPPKGFVRLKQDTLGEFGMRSLFVENLGAGNAGAAAEGWNGDALAVYVRENAKAGIIATPGALKKGDWWFCWESAWDSEQDAREFAEAFLIYWRVTSKDKKLGDLKKAAQTVKVGNWTIAIERADKRVALSWWN